MNKDLQLVLGLAVVGGVIVWAYNREKNKRTALGEETSNLFGWGNCIGRGGRPTPCFGKEKYSIHPDNYNLNGQ